MVETAKIQAMDFVEAGSNVAFSRQYSLRPRYQWLCGEPATILRIRHQSHILHGAQAFAGCAVAMDGSPRRTER